MARKKKSDGNSRRKKKQTTRNSKKIKNKKDDNVILQNRYKDLKSKFKLKDFSIVLHDISLKEIALPSQKLVNIKNVDPTNEINKSQECKSNKNHSKERKSSKKKCKATTKRNSSNKHKKKKQEKNDDFLEEPCVSKEPDLPLIFNNNDNTKVTRCPDVLEQLVKKCKIDTEDNAEEQDLNLNENSKENVITYEHCVEGSVQQKALPKIRNDSILPKNTVKLIKFDNPMEISNNYLDTVYSTNTPLQKESNECVSIEVPNNVVELTEENLSKFINDDNKRWMLTRNDFCSNQTYLITKCENFSEKGLLPSNSIELSLKRNEDGQYASHKKRSWIQSKKNMASDRTAIKRVKLDRKCFRDNGVTKVNDSVYLSYDNKSTISSNYNSMDVINNYKMQNLDDYLTLYSNDGNTLCKVQYFQESTKTDLDVTIRATDVSESKETQSSSNTQLTHQEQVISDTRATNVAGINISNNVNTRFDRANEERNDAENIIENNLSESKETQSSSNTQLTHQEQVKSVMHDNSQSDDYDDCISLYAESFMSFDEPSITSNKNEVEDTLQSYNMNENTLNNYWQQNILECNKAFANSEEQSILENKICSESYKAKSEDIKENNILPLDELLIDDPNIDSVNIIQVNNNNSLCLNKNYDLHKENIPSSDQVATTSTKRVKPFHLHILHKGFCYMMLQWGHCKKTSCYFNHDLQKLIRKLILHYKQYLTSIVDYMYSKNYYYLLQGLYIESLNVSNVDFIMDTYKKLYSREHVRPNITRAVIKALLKKGINPKDVVGSFCDILISNDIYTSRCIVDTLINELEIGEYWNTLHKLFVYTKPSKRVIECILNECIIKRKFVQDIYNNIIIKLDPEEINELNSNLMTSFNDLLKKESQQCSNNKASQLLTNNETSNEESSEKLFMLHSITNLPAAQSQYKDRFWKLYLMLYNIKEALIHEDYDYVVSILETYQKETENETLFSHACFKILCTEIKHSEYYILKIIEHAVHIGASSVLYKLLLEVAKYILMKLVIEETWILAYKLLKRLQIYDIHCSATFIILTAEIYLANKHAIEALMLLKKSNIISLDCKKWKVISNAQDFYLRVNVMHNLLDVLCVESPEHAFFLFQYLIKDQSNNFQPINLTYYVDKLMLKLLIENETELMNKMGYIIVKYDFTIFNKSIFRAIIASLVHSDIMLAKQLYQYASNFGVYNITQILPVTHVIINLDWVEEEIYLAFFDLFKRYASEIGHSIERFNPTRLTIYIGFQATPTESHLLYENVKDEQYKRIDITKRLVRQVLCKQFDPPIRLSKKVNGTIMKLQNKTVLNYLKSLHEDRVQF